MDTDWQDIATAPRDGTAVDLWTDHRITDAVFRDGGWLKWDRFVRDKRQTAGQFTGTNRYRQVTRPIYWMPLPEPPKDST